MFQSVFIIKDNLPPAVPRWDEGEILESSKIIRRDIHKFMKKPDPYKAHDPHSISPHLIKECSKTTISPLEIFRYPVDDRSVSREWVKSITLSYSLERH